jgi:N6-L-threonylcarbamoyladenine synthase
MYILGIETSCDETAASVLEAKGGSFKILSNIISSQIEIHKKYYGVVPEIAAREHVLHIIPVVNEALEKAGIEYQKIAAIAITSGPGLITSLVTGVETAKTLAYVWRKPLISVNHIASHISANFIKPLVPIKFPAVGLTVSGGHTNLVLIKNYGSYQIIGETLDDAAGEAFDKGAKMLQVGYPGGPVVSRLAERYKATPDLKFPRPMLNSLDFNFSFSGLKTAMLYQIQKDKNYKKRINEYCKELETAIVETLIKKTIKAAKKYKAKTVLLSGGVAANKLLRQQLPSEIKKNLSGVNFNMPALEYTTDNAAMVAMAGYYKFQKKQFTPWAKIKENCNLELK